MLGTFFKKIFYPTSPLKESAKIQCLKFYKNSIKNLQKESFDNNNNKSKQPGKNLILTYKFNVLRGVLPH